MRYLIVLVAVIGLALIYTACSESRTAQMTSGALVEDGGAGDTGIGTRLPKCLMENPIHGKAGCSPGDQWACDPFKYNAFKILPELWWYGKARIKDLWCEMLKDQYVTMRELDGSKEYALPFTVFEFDNTVKMGGANDLPATLVVRGGYGGVRNGSDSWEIYDDSYVFDLEPGQDGYLFVNSNGSKPYMWFFAPIIDGRVKVYSRWYSVQDFEAAVFK